MSLQAEKTVVRAIVLPVSAPVGIEWKKLDAALLTAFRLSTDLANWCVRRLYLADDPTSTKTPASVKTWYGYGDAGTNYPRVAEWAGAMASLSLVTRMVQRKYVQQRFDVIVRHDSSLLTYRFPQPYPVHNKVWKVEKTEAGLVLSLPLPGVGRVSLRLQRGQDFRRQLAMLQQILDGNAKRGEAALYRDRKGNLLAKIVGTFPAQERSKTAENVCFLHTDPGAFFVAEVNGHTANISNGDHIKREVAKHKTFLQRAGEDKKREVRMDRPQRRNFDKAIDARCARQHDRVDTAIHQITAQVVRYCERQRVGLVVYDDANTSFIPEGFAWFTVRERLADKLRAKGIELLSRDHAPKEGFEEWLSNPKAVWATALAGKKLLATANRKKSHPSVSPLPKNKRGNAKP